MLVRLLVATTRKVKTITIHDGSFLTGSRNLIKRFLPIRQAAVRQGTKTANALIFCLAVLLGQLNQSHTYHPSHPWTGCNSALRFTCVVASGKSTATNPTPLALL